MIGPWKCTAFVAGAESKVTPARSLGALLVRHGFDSGTELMIPAVHWLVERVQRPATGIGSTVAVPSFAVPVVSAPAVPFCALPESFQVWATRSLPTQSAPLRQAPVPCS